ncbi:MAG: hypothetical protein HC831_09735 [Chloroflexia bacterium]|nr:hypothetical protein [Chloroflexia bacterium]
MGGKAIASGAIGAAIAVVGWNTFGSGTLFNSGKSLAGCNTFAGGLEAVFGSQYGNYGLKYFGNAALNVYHDKEKIKAGDESWDGVGLLAGNEISAMISTKGKFEPNIKDGLRVFAGVTILDNLSDNYIDGKFELHSLHLGFVGYDFDKKGMYTMFSKGLRGSKRFEMGYETLLSLCALKKDILLPFQAKKGRKILRSYENYCHQYVKISNYGRVMWIKIPTGTIGYYSRLAYMTANDVLSAADQIFSLFPNKPDWYQESLEEYWWDSLWKY